MKQTSLHGMHEALGARMVEFGGWSMPVQYASILEEARIVRGHVGLFDLGHMGRVRVTGPQATEFLDRINTNHCAKIPVGSIRYSLFLRENGFPIDDLLVYRDDESAWYLVINASNTAEDLAWMRQHAADFDVQIQDETDETAMLAVQGPKAVEALQPLVEGFDLASLKYYRFAHATVCGMADTRISRTGYTGEIGFELYFPTAEGPRVWDRIVDVGEAHGLRPIGLGARDTLRLEAGMALFGHEIDAEHDPLEAGLAFAVKLTEDKGDFIGRAALEARHANATRRLVGVQTDGPRVPRQGHALMAPGTDDEVGHVCSGAKSPTLDTNIATAYVRLGLDTAGQELELDIKGKRQPCVVQDLPFFSKTRK